MKKIINKTIACILAVLLVIEGVFLFELPGSRVAAGDAEPISEKILSVKCQFSKDMSQMRIVTTIDGQKIYGNVGFEITFLADSEDKQVYKEHKVKSVFHEIDAQENGVKYEYGPKVFNANSEWFATYTITDIPASYQDNGIVIKPFVTMTGSTEKIYGQHRYLTMLDAEKGIVSLPIKGELTNPTVENASVEEPYFDGTYTHVRVKADYSKLPSISTYTVKDNGKEYTAKYRCLNSQVKSDQSWYTESDGDDKVIVTAGDMFGFQKLSEKMDFAEDTIYLGADIDLNPGFDASTYSKINNETTTRPDSANDWNPIGCSGVTAAAQSYPKFAGTFDGDMHSISGVFSVKWISGRNAIGLFGDVNGATIKNFTLKNSYFWIDCTKDVQSCMGSVVGVLNGTLDTVKCDETVFLEIQNANQYNGGLVGKATNGTLQNCWFAGKISGGAAIAHTGGLLGGLPSSGNQCTITNCLFTGKIEARANTGGLVGAAWTGSQLTIKKTLYAGEFVSVSGVSPWNIGTVLGNAKADTTTATDIYIGSDSVVGSVIGSNASNSTEKIYKLNRTTELTGITAYMKMNVDFYEKDGNKTGKWYVMAESYPILTSFADTSNPVDLTTAEGARTCWFDSTDKQSSYTLYSPADFRGFQELSATENFHQIEIKLGTDIDLNPGWTAGSNNEQANKWTPIGRSATDTSVIIPFRGTFNGQGHTIKGVYVESNLERIGLFATTGQDAMIQNFTLENSYINSTRTSGTGSVGSVVGRLGGTLDTVKSSADVVLAGAEYAGGLVGDINSAVGGVITNCWFAGSVCGTGSHHGALLGGVRNVGGSDSNPKCDIEHCLVTGEIDMRSNTGGICGTVWKNGSTVTISDTLFAGRIKDISAGSVYNLGAIVGNATNGTVIIEKANVYCVTEAGTQTKIGAVGSNTKARDNITPVETEKLCLGDVYKNASGLSVYPEGWDSSSDGDNKQYWWYASEPHVVLASFSTPVTYSTLKVATYNIGSCIKQGTGNHTSIRNDIVNFIKNEQIDLCLMQEVDKDCDRTGNTDQAKEIAKALGYEYAYATALKVHDSLTYGWVRDYGIAIVSRYPITSTESVMVNESIQNEPRAILKAIVDVNGTNVAVINTHVDNNNDSDKSKTIGEVTRMVSAIPANTPIIFGGDLNGSPNAAVPVAIAAMLQSTTAERNANTYPVGAPETQLDYIYTNSQYAHGYAAVLDPSDAALGRLSDHRPLVVSLYMNIK